MNSEKEQGHYSRLDALRGSLREIQERVVQMEAELEALEQNGRPLESSNGHVSRLNLAAVSESVRQLATADTQELILETYLSQIQRFAERIILFLQKENQFLPWKAVDFPSESLEKIIVAEATDPIMKAARSGETILQEGAVFETLPWLAASGKEPARYICLPLVFDRTVPVVLYADSHKEIDVDSVELLTHLTVLVLKNHYLSFLVGSQQEVDQNEALAPPSISEMEPTIREEAVETTGADKLSEMHPDTAEASSTFGETEAPVSDTEPEKVPPQDHTPFAAEPESGVSEQIESDQGLDSEPAPEEPISATETSEQGAPAWQVSAAESPIPETPVEEERRPEPEPPEEREATPAEREPEFRPEMEETLTTPVQAAEEAGQEPGQETVEELEAGPPAAAEAPGAPPELLSEEEEAFHNDARRFARLLVSEIKLYNEESVEEGRRHGDLYRRLQSDIDRSREMYEKRVDSSVKKSFDYFHAELVRILAREEPALLGEEYPGSKLSDDSKSEQ